MQRQLVTKRLFDLAVCLILGVPAAAATGALMVIVRIFDGAPALFSQERVGRDGVPFTIYKIRTLPPGTPEAATHLIAPPATGIARLLRRTRLDELPQFWNVLRGEMSLVGPRPSLLSQVELIEERTDRGLLAIPPGLTGRGQVLGVDMSDARRLAEVEAAYLDELSVRADLRYLLATFTGRFDRTDPSQPGSDA